MSAPHPRTDGAIRPIRLQLSRARGFDLQAISRAANGLPARRVTRPGPFGNWLRAGKPGRLWIRAGNPHDDGLRTTIIAELPGAAIGPGTAAAVYRQWLTRAETPFVPGIGSLDDDLRQAVADALRRKRDEVIALLPSLRGSNLACTCPLTFDDGAPCPCHADILIDLANRERP